MRTMTLSAAALLLASALFADATVQQKTQVRFGGPLGGLINAFGRKATHEGLTSDTAVHNDRKSTRTGDSGEIIDLDQEKIYHVDYGRQTYTVTTFAEMRKQYEEQKERARKNEAKGEKSQNQGPEYEIEYRVKSTGNKETINGWATHEEIATVTVHEKGKKLEESGGFVLTADMWIGPRVAAMRELFDFDRRFMQKLYGSALEADMRQMAAVMAATPAFGKAMKTFGEKQAKLDGTAIRTNMTFETVAAPNQASSEEQSSSQSPASALGGLLGRMKQRREANQSGPARSTLLNSTTELLKATTSASAEAVSIPASFRQK